MYPSRKARNTVSSRQSSGSPLAAVQAEVRKHHEESPEEPAAESFDESRLKSYPEYSPYSAFLYRGQSS